MLSQVYSWFTFRNVLSFRYKRKMKDLQSKFMEYLRFEKRYSKHTITAYSKDLAQFNQFMTTTYELLEVQKIKRNHIRTWMAALQEDKVSPRSIHRKISTLSSFFKYMRRIEAIDVSPMLNIIKPKLEKRLASFIREDKIDNVLKESSNDKKVETIAEMNPQLIIEILYQTGMRRNEILTLTLKNTDVQKRELKVLGKGNKERIIPINSELSNLIESYVTLRNKVAVEENPYLLVLPNGKKLYPKYVYNTVKKVLENTTTLNKKSPHILRHTFATHLLNEGADINAIKELLGHSSLAATQIYMHNGIEKLKNVHKKAHPKA